MTVASPSGTPTPSVGAALLPENVRHTELPAVGGSLVERVLDFRTHLRSWANSRRPSVVHIRSIFEGYPIAKEKNRWCDALVFEVNGLPSIELKYHYPQAADDRELMSKLLVQEQCCLDAADLVITVSEVNAASLRGRGVDPARLCVIPNGVDPQLFHWQPPRFDRAIDDDGSNSRREIRLLYSGTFSAWQGVQTAIEALALYRRDAPARLTIVGSGRTGQATALREMAYRLGVQEFVEVKEGVSQNELVRLHHFADVVLAPLVPNDRNLIQGCCPLKVLEAMASGTPLVASDLPVVSALARPEIDALLVRPGSAKAIKDALVRLHDSPNLATELSHNARRRIEEHFTWSAAQSRLREAYQRHIFSAEKSQHVA